VCVCVCACVRVCVCVCKLVAGQERGHLCEEWGAAGAAAGNNGSRVCRRVVSMWVGCSGSGGGHLCEEWGAAQQRVQLLEAKRPRGGCWAQDGCDNVVGGGVGAGHVCEE
jgi:hypothetical protein